jgi:hypothetical protein
MINPRSIRLAALLVLVGDVVSTVIVRYIHTQGGETIEATFMNDAASKQWVAIHLAQFLGMAMLLAGVLAFFLSLDAPTRTSRWLGYFGSITGFLSRALAAIVFTVDGVANKIAVDAWAAARRPARAGNDNSGQVRPAQGGSSRLSPPCIHTGARVLNTGRVPDLGVRHRPGG